MVDLEKIAKDEFFKMYKIDQEAYYNDPAYHSFITMRFTLFLDGFSKAAKYIYTYMEVTPRPSEKNITGE